VGTRASLDAVARRKKSYHCARRELNTVRPARSLVSIPTELYRLLSHNIFRYTSYRYPPRIHSVLLLPELFLTI
jgi:hypothetical protein